MDAAVRIFICTGAETSGPPAKSGTPLPSTGNCELVETTMTLRIAVATTAVGRGPHLRAVRQHTNRTEGRFLEGSKRLGWRPVQGHADIDVVNLRAIGAVFVFSPPTDTPSRPDDPARGLTLHRCTPVETDRRCNGKYRFHCSPLGPNSPPVGSESAADEEARRQGQLVVTTPATLIPGRSRWSSIHRRNRRASTRRRYGIRPSPGQHHPHASR